MPALMSVELTLLLWSTVLLGAYLTTQAMLWRFQKGFVYSATARDDEPPANVMTARGQKALRNFLETYGVFIALVVVIEFAGRSDALTQWGAHIWFWCRWVYLPLYVFGVPGLRSLVWFVGACGLALMFFGILF
jgi:uncharacterized MAPEG superfamily protein